MQLSAPAKKGLTNILVVQTVETVGKYHKRKKTRKGGGAFLHKSGGRRAGVGLDLMNVPCLRLQNESTCYSTKRRRYDKHRQR